MGKNKILSISIAAYQVENTIGKCLDSFLKSRYFRELELLVINDGSKDRTAEVVSAYVEKYPNVIKLINKDNGGHGSTINKSLSIATGKFYKVLDGDDWVDVNELDRLIEFLKETKAELVVNRCREVYPSYSQVVGCDIDYELGKVYDFSEVFSNKITIDNLFSMHTTTILTDRLREVNMHILEKCFYADTLFIYYVGLAARTVAFHDSCVYQYRLGAEGQSVSASGIYKHAEDLIKIERKLFSLYQADGERLKDDKRKEYIFTLLESRYNMLFDWFSGIITRNDKDIYMLEFLEEANRDYKDIVSKCKLSMYNRLISIYPSVLIPVFRIIRKSIIWLTLHRIKTFFTGSKGTMKVIDDI